MTVTNRPAPSPDAPWRPSVEAQAGARDGRVPDGGLPRRDGGWGWLLLLLAPLLCCGLPLLAAAGAALGTATWGIAVGIPLAVVAAVTGWLWMRRRRSSGRECCTVDSRDRRR